MSRSVERVRRALEAAGIAPEIVQTPAETRTAAQAAAVVGCPLDAIVKSMIFAGRESGALYLFLTPGGRQVASAPAEGLAGEPLARARPEAVRRQTGFAIGGVAPVGHLTPPVAFIDPALFCFNPVWAAAGTPHHLFAIEPRLLARLAGARAAPFTQAA